MINIRAAIVPVRELFKGFYVIPAYQRDYVWEEEHIEQLLDDVRRAFEMKHESYFLGTVVVSPSKDLVGVYDLIDGQQRLTTIMLMLCAFKNYLRTRQTMPYGAIDEALMGNPSVTSDETRLRVYPQYDESRELIGYLAGPDGQKVNHALRQGVFDDEAQSIFANLVRGYRTIMYWLEATYTSVDEFRAYFTYFMQDVVFIRIEALNLTEAMRLFESINDRGVHLDPVSLLKNMLFMHVDSEDFVALRDEWSKMVRQVQHGKVRDDPIRFIRYVVMAEYLGKTDELVREDRLYDWFNENAHRTGHTRNPQRFVKSLQDRGKDFINIRTGKNTHKEFCDAASNLLLISKSIKQHIPVMMAARHLPTSMQDDIAVMLEDTIFVIMVTSKFQSFEKKLTELTELVRNIRNPEGKSAVHALLNSEFIAPWASTFQLRIQNFAPGRVKTNVMRYALAKLTRAMMQDTVPLAEYIKGMDVCQILSREIPTGITELQQQQYVSAVESIGNFVLIEKKLAMAVNKGEVPFEYALTQTSTPYGLRMAHAGEYPYMHSVPKKWDVNAVAARRDYLVNLATQVWHIR
jgi:hypothetical protein